MTTYILPGMGADSSMYGETFTNLQGVEYVDWLPFQNEQSISDVAKRVIREYAIQPGDTVGGSSLGGIVAAEISTQISLNKVLLIGSTLTPGSVNPILKKLGTYSEIIPLRLIQLLAGKTGAVIDNSLLKMFSKSDSFFITTMCTAVFEWQGNPQPNCDVAHIHGAKDKVIFPPATGAEIIQDGGHLIAMTHEPSVVEFIKNHIHTN